MRGVFAVTLANRYEHRYPSNADLVQYFRECGWEPIHAEKFAADIEEITHIKAAAELIPTLGTVLPRGWDEGTVIFHGYIANNQTRFVVSRFTEGQIVFRLQHTILRPLLSSIEIIATSLFKGENTNDYFESIDRQIVILEQQAETIVLIGRLTANPIREAIQTNRMELFLIYIMLFLFIFSITIVISEPQSGTTTILAFLLITVTFVNLITQSYNVIKTLNYRRKSGIVQWSLPDNTPLLQNQD